MTTNITTARAAGYDFRAIVQRYRMDNWMGNHHTGADADHVIALSITWYRQRKAGPVYRIATTSSGTEWLAQKGKDGRWWPVAPLRYLGHAAAA